MRFVVIAAPRTGSTHLTLLLHGQEDIFCNGEVFHKRRVFVRWPASDLSPDIRAELKELKRHAPELLLDRIFAQNYGRAHVGFKILFNHGGKVLKRLIHDTSVRKILLFRGNVLASYASGLAANATHTWHLRVGKTRPETPKVQFDMARFLSFYKRRTAHYRRAIVELNETNQIFHLVRYEEINDPHLFAQLIGFIGVDPKKAQLRAARTKLNSSDIISRFANADEVHDFLNRFNLMHWRFEGSTSLSDVTQEVLEPQAASEPHPSTGSG